MSYRIKIPDRGVPEVYGDMAEGVVRAFGTFYDEMEDLCRKHSYRPMVLFTNQIQRFYTEDLRSHVMACFDQWDQSDFSIPALARSIHAGSAAESTSRSHMAELRDRLEQMFSRGYVPLQVDDNAPALDTQNIIQINEHIRGFLSKVAMIRDTALSTANARSSENELYGLIIPVLQNTGDSLYESFEGMLSTVLEGAELYELGVGNTLQRRTASSVIDGKQAVRWPADEVFY